VGHFFSTENRVKKKTDSKRPLPTAYLNRMKCDVCPRNTDRFLQHPKMLPTGAKHPLIYILGEAPGRTEDEKGRQFVGESGQFLRERIPDGDVPIRWNNTIRCRPPKNRTPVENEIECCRPFQVEDIEAKRPRVVIVTGNVPLQWAVPGATRGITAWRGRLVPAKIGSHVCWVYPILHPSGIIRSGGDGGAISGDDERKAQALEVVFRTDLQNIYQWVRNDVRGLRKPYVADSSEYRVGIRIYPKCTEEDAEAVIDALKRAAQEDVVTTDLETHNLRPYWADSKILWWYQAARLSAARASTRGKRKVHFMLLGR
jgi:DNA polymerase